MFTPIHVAATVGGAGAVILPHMLRHYQGLGVSSFVIAVHVRVEDHVFVDWVRRMAASCGIEVAAVLVDADPHRAQRLALGRAMATHPDDWWLPVDIDELQQYPAGLAATLDECERRGYDHVKGCLIDRVSADGTLPHLQPERLLGEQYPLGGFITYHLLGGDPRKVVAVKGRGSLGPGNHAATTQTGCPIDQHFIQVHHFKWVGTVVAQLQARRTLYREQRKPWWVESDRFLRYMERNGRIDVTDSRLMMAPCLPDYPYWEHARRMAQGAQDLAVGRPWTFST